MAEPESCYRYCSSWRLLLHPYPSKGSAIWNIYLMAGVKGSHSCVSVFPPCIHGLSAFTATRGFAQEALSPLPPSSPRLVRSWAQVGSGVRPCGPGVLGREEGAGTTIGLSSSVSKYPESVDGSRVRKDIHTSSHRARGAIHGG